MVSSAGKFIQQKYLRRILLLPGCLDHASGPFLTEGKVEPVHQPFTSVWHSVFQGQSNSTSDILKRWRVGGFFSCLNRFKPISYRKDSYEAGTTNWLMASENRQNNTSIQAVHVWTEQLFRSSSGTYHEAHLSSWEICKNRRETAKK